MRELRKRLVYPIANLSLGAVGRWNARRYNIRNTIAVASSPRGGSTWLAEIVCSLSGHHMLWEPLHPANNPRCLEYGFGWQNYIPDADQALRQREYMEALLTGRDLSTRTTTSLSFRPLGLLRPKAYVAKFVNANLLLPWITKQFPVRAVLMIRHPCAVVASQLAHGAWAGITRDNMTVRQDMLSDFPALADALDMVRTKEQVLAFEWAAQTLVPTACRSPRWFLTTYERMATDRAAEVERIFAYLGEQIPEQTLERTRQPSATTVAQSNIATGDSPLTGWRRRLSSRQVEQVLEITEMAGLSFYTEALEPDYAALEMIGD